MNICRVQECQWDSCGKKNAVPLTLTIQCEIKLLFLVMSVTTLPSVSTAGKQTVYYISIKPRSGRDETRIFS